MEKRVRGDGRAGRGWGRKREELTTDFQFTLHEEKDAVEVRSSGCDGDKIPLDVVCGGAGPGDLRSWIAELDGGGLGGCVDGSRARRRNGEGEGGEDRGQKLHGSMGVNEWRASMRGEESQY